jgi:predicted transposase/invertase (TIGR01784 family)
MEDKAALPDEVAPVGRLMELSDEERQLLLEEAQEKARRDQASRIKAAYREGLEEGKTEAIAEWKAEVAKRMLQRNISIDLVVSCTGFSPAEVTQMANDLR